MFKFWELIIICFSASPDPVCFDGANDCDSIRIPDTIFLQAAFYHPTVGWHPGGVISTVVPGLSKWVILIIDDFNLSHFDLNLNDNLVIIWVIDGIAFRFLQVSGEVHTPTEHPVRRLAKTWSQDRSSTCPCCAMVHDVGSTSWPLVHLNYPGGRKSSSAGRRVIID